MLQPLDLKNDLISGQSVPPEAKTATANGTGIDLQKSDGICFAELGVGVVTGTTPTLDVKIQESSDDSTYTDITGATFTQVTATPSPATGKTVIAFNRTKRYVRAVATIAGTTPVFPMVLDIYSTKKIL